MSSVAREPDSSRRLSRVGAPKTAMGRALAAITRFVSRLSIRLLAFNILLVFMPAIGILTLESFEDQLLSGQERAMVQQGRLLAAALGERDILDAEEAKRILVNLNQRQEYRLRVVSPNGTVVADSSSLGPRREGTAESTTAATSEVRGRLTYRIGLFFYRLIERALEWPTSSPPVESAPATAPGTSDRLLAPEVRQALAGRYGSASRPSPTTRSLVMFSALPVESEGVVVGAVLVSRSTIRILQALYDFRTATVEVILLSVVVAAVLSLLVSTTIARPVRRLQRDARALLDRRGRLRRPFEPLARLDEIGDLSRALARLTRRLESHQSFMESFASDVSHEFKNPLASIRGVLDVLPTVDDPRDRARFLTMALDDVARLEQLLTAVREIAVIDSQLDRQEVESVPLATLARAAIARRALTDNGHQPRFKLDEHVSAVAVAGSSVRMTQVIENLLDNAAGFSPPGTEVDVTIDDHGDRATLRVADRGPGFPVNNLERVFDRFFSDRPGTVKGAGGHTGLGLAIVKSIVEGYGGNVHAANREGGGAELTVELPIVAASQAEAEASLSAQENSR